MGCAKEPARHELRQTEPLPALLLRKRHHAKSGGRAVRLQIRVQPGRALHHGVHFGQQKKQRVVERTAGVQSVRRTAAFECALHQPRELPGRVGSGAGHQLQRAVRDLQPGVRQQPGLPESRHLPQPAAERCRTKVVLLRPLGGQLRRIETGVEEEGAFLLQDVDTEHDAAGRECGRGQGHGRGQKHRAQPQSVCC